MLNFGDIVSPAINCPKERSSNYCTAVLWIWSIILLSFLILGIVCNSLSIIVLSMLPKKPFTLLLRLIAVSDTIFLKKKYFENSAYHIQGIRLRNTFQVYCTFEQWLILSSGYISLWLLVLLTIQSNTFTSMVDRKHHL